VEFEFESEVSFGDVARGVEDFEGGTLSSVTVAGGVAESRRREFVTLRPSGAEFPREPRDGFGVEAAGISIRLRGL